jgi:hypothetical protein
VFVLNVVWYDAWAISPRISQVKYLPTFITFVKMKCINATMAEPVAYIEPVVTPNLGEIVILLNLDIPYFFIPHVGARRANSLQKSIDRIFAMKCTFVFLIAAYGSKCNVPGERGPNHRAVAFLHSLKKAVNNFEDSLVFRRLLSAQCMDACQEQKTKSGKISYKHHCGVIVKDQQNGCIL